MVRKRPNQFSPEAAGMGNPGNFFMKRETGGSSHVLASLSLPCPGAETLEDSVPY